VNERFGIGATWEVARELTRPESQYRHDDLFGPEAATERGPARLGGSRRPPLTGALVGAAGGALAAYGFTRRGVMGSALRTVGTAMLASGLHEIGPALQQRERRHAVDAQKGVDIAAPVDEVFALWSEPASLGRIFGNVTEVGDLGDGRWRWQVPGPRGAPVTWTTATTVYEPGAMIGWQSEPDAPVQSSGLVRFTPLGPRTRVDVRFTHGPPAGAVGRAPAELLGPNPRRQLNDDLARMKALLEGDAGGRTSNLES
jgi:uncharacterized membrane protein